MADNSIAAYRGSDPYIFVCYGHEDRSAVLAELSWLNGYGINTWYDEGIMPGHQWSDEIAEAIQGCSHFLYFVTPRSVESEHCRRELNFAQEEGRDVITVHLVDTEVPAGLRLSLNNRQALLKHQLEEETYRQQLIRTLHGRAEMPGEPGVPESGTTRTAAIVGAAVIAALGIYWLLLTDDTAPESVPVPDQAEALVEALADAQTPPANDLLPNSVAVLPFDNLSPDPNDAYFAAGIHEEILNQLSKINDLNVIARTTMLRYAASDKSIPQIGEELRVSTVMEGSVRYAGNRVRISAQLIDATTGAQLWSEAYEEDLVDIFGIQLAIASRLADQFRADFPSDEQVRIGQASTSNPEAYGYYLQALSIYGNFVDTDPIHELLEKAIALDPEFAAAMAFNGLVYNYETFVSRFADNPFTPDRAARTAALAEEYGQMAAEIDPDLAYVQLLLGNVERAYELNPNDYRVLSGLGIQRIFAEEKVEEGMGILLKSIEVNPQDAANIWFVASNLYLLERWEEAIAQARNAVRVAPERAFTHAALALFAAYGGDEALARESAANAEALGPSVYSYMDLARAYARLGDPQQVQRVFQEAEKAGQTAPDDPYWQFTRHITLGDSEKALDALEAMIDMGIGRFGLAQFFARPMHPSFSAIHDHPRYRAQVDRLMQIRAENANR